MADIEIETGMPSTAFEGIMLGAQAAAGQAATSEASAAASEAATVTHALAASLSATAAQTAGPVYPDIATGLAATAEGATFNVQGNGATTYMVLYRKTAGAAVHIADVAARSATKVLSVKSYGVVGGLPDETAAVQAAITDAIAQAPCVLDFLGLDLKIGTGDLTGADMVWLRGSGATIRPLDPVQGGDQHKTTGHFSANAFGTLGVDGFRFVQTPSFHYSAAISLYSGTLATITANTFTGCGFAVRCQQVQHVHRERNTYRQIGMYPRPTPEFATDGTGYNAAVELYGGGFRAVLCSLVTGGDGEDLENNLPASGYHSDVEGGIGGFTVYLSDDVRLAGRSINAPGQGFSCAGGLQGQDVVGMLLSATPPDLATITNADGQRITFDHCISSGCNQEGQTSYGVKRVKLIAPDSTANRLAAWELWECIDAEVTGGISDEPASAGHPIQAGGYGNVGGDGACHIVGCWNVGVTNHAILAARFNGFRVDGSYYVRINSCRIDNYGADNFANYRASGVSCGAFQYDNSSGATRNADYVSITNCQFQPAGSNTVGGDIFAIANDQVIYSHGNMAVGRAVTHINASGAFAGLPQPFVAGGTGLAHGGTIASPNALLLNGRVVGVGTAATTILTFPALSTALGHDSALVTVNGGDDQDGSRNFSDTLHVMPGIGFEKLGAGIDSGLSPARTYSLSGSNLQLAMAAGSFSVTCVGTQVKNGNRNG